MKLDLVNEDCLSQILSLTSPIDACNISIVSSELRLSADSDKVWETFLPNDYEEILSRLVSPLSYSSKKELFCKLCSPRLIDRGGKVKFKTQILSPYTLYGIYLIVKFADRAFGLDTLPSDVSLQVGDVQTRAKVYLHCKLGGQKQGMLERACFLNRMRSVASSSGLEKNETRIDPIERVDGWIEIELGSFYTDGSDDKEVQACLKEVSGEHLKGGLIVEGIELRPK